MNKALEKFWTSHRRFWRRDVKNGHVSGDHRADLRQYWEDKDQERSIETDPNADFESYYRFMTAKPERGKKTAKKSVKKKSAKKKTKTSWWPFW